jgi:DNA-directed RNA polymerase alpha subunit
MELYGGPGKRKKRNPPDPYWVKFITPEEKEKKRIERWQSVAIADSGLPVRVANIMEKHGILTVGDLLQHTLEDLQQIANLGDITIRRCGLLLDKLDLPHHLK